MKVILKVAVGDGGGSARNFEGERVDQRECLQACLAAVVDNLVLQEQGGRRNSSCVYISFSGANLPRVLLLHRSKPSCNTLAVSFFSQSHYLALILPILCLSSAPM